MARNKYVVYILLRLIIKPRKAVENLEIKNGFFMHIFACKFLLFITFFTLLSACSADYESSSTSTVQHKPSQLFTLAEDLQLTDSNNLSGIWLIVGSSDYRYSEEKDSSYFSESYHLQSRKILSIRQEPGELYVTECAGLQHKRYRLEGDRYVLGGPTESESDPTDDKVLRNYSQLSFSDFNQLSGIFEYRSQQHDGVVFSSIEQGRLQGIKIANSTEFSDLSSANPALLSIGSASIDNSTVEANSDYFIRCYQLSYRVGKWQYETPQFTDAGSHSGKSLLLSAQPLSALEAEDNPLADAVVMRYRQLSSSGMETDASTLASVYNSDSRDLSIEFLTGIMAFKTYERSVDGEVMTSFDELIGDVIFSETNVKADINANSNSSAIDFRLQLSY